MPTLSDLIDDFWRRPGQLVRIRAATDALLIEKRRARHEEAMSQTRALTPAEERNLDAAWERYLDSRGAGPGVAWGRYQDYLDKAGIIPTLAGYRKRLDSNVKE